MASVRYEASPVDGWSSPNPSSETYDRVVVLWKDPAGTRLRDYYRVEDQEGRRFWLYREGLPDDGRGGMPRWFMQGAFA